MKSSKGIKNELYKYIDSIDNEKTLWMLREDVMAYLKKEKETETKDKLTAEEISKINTGLEQIENEEP